MKRALSFVCVLLPLLTDAAPLAQQGSSMLTYPSTRQSDHVDTYHGVRVADPYDWLEGITNPDVARWVEAQNKLAQPILEAIPARERIKQRLTQLWNYERYDVPVKRGGRYFFLRNDGLQNQSVLYVTESLDATPRVLLDPNTFSGDATVALGEFVPSPNGKLVAYSLSDGGTDWRIWKVRDVATGKDRPDALKFIKFREAAWTADSSALYYARYPLRANGTGDDSKQMSIYLHQLGSTQEADKHVYSITDHPTRYPYPQVSDDGRYLIINVYDGSQKAGIYYQKLDRKSQPTGPVVRLFDTFDADYEVVAEIDDVFYVVTTAGAPKSRLVAVPAREGGASKARDIIPERDSALLDATVIGGRIVAQYVKDAYSVVSVSDLKGKFLYDVKLPGYGQVTGFEGNEKDPETFFSYTDFVTPGSISRLNTTSGKVDVFRSSKIAADTKPYVTEQVFYRSKDGTRVPMFITHKRDLVKNGQAPLMLYGYGGFNISMQPSFSVPALVWMEMGGVYAVANLRGGSEYGEAWHSAGTRSQKQNVFDDFIAAAEWLVAEKYTSTPKLAIRGRSNGGLLVGAVLTQRPDLFGAALPAVGVLDMLRYHTASANARQWSTDYGLSEDSADFKAQYAYSPVHNVRNGTCYPPTLVTTADRDDRVVPWHSYKFTAALQRAQGCPNPVLLRVETRAGHGAGKPVWMQIEDFADQWAFLVQSLKME
ncbi:MAG TPA: prolyl oligopeptidase family serine peptidase [Povalibacter sp.]